MLVNESTQTVRASAFMMEAGLVCVIWVALFMANDELFSVMKINSFVSWFFLPAALRMIAVMILEWSAVAGLFVGAMMTSRWLNVADLLDCIPLAIISALCPLLAVRFCRFWLRLNTSLAGLTSAQLGFFALTGALLNAIPSQLYLHFVLSDQSSLNAVVPMIIGDLVGTLAVLYLASWGLKVLSSRRWM